MDEGESKKGPNKINISSSSLVALKAELLHKQAQVQQARASGLTNVRSKPTPKKLKQQGENKGNKGVEQRALRDEIQKTTEEPSLEKSKLMLEEKAKLYESLSKDKKLLEEDTISEDQSLFLVNFQQKVIENVMKERRSQSTKKPARGPPSSSSSSDDEVGAEADYPASNPEEEWVDYVDSFGRTRRCLRKDLPVFQQADAELNKSSPKSSSTPSYTNFVKSSEPEDGASSSTFAQDEEARRLRREKWEQEAEENARKSKLHYQDVLFQEARQHGVGFYQFSKDEEERAKQMEELERIRKQTEASRSAVIQTAGAKKAALDARLKKVRERKRQKLGLPPLKEKPAAPPPEPEEAKPLTAEQIEAIKAAEEEEERRRKAAAALPKTVKIRPWDLGKEGVPSMKRPEMLQTAWVDKKREERPMEFAPPSAYSASSAPPSRQGRPTTRQHPPPPPRRKSPSPEPQRPILTEDSIAAGLAFMKNMTFPFNTPKGPSVEEQEAEEIEEEDDFDLRPPGETMESPSAYQQPPQRSGVAIPPPTSMDYYNNTNSSSQRNSRGAGPRIDLTESFRQGLENRK